MALPTALLAVTLNAVYQSLGNEMDFPGSCGGGKLIPFVTSLLYRAILCGLAATGGHILAQKLRSDTSQTS